MQGAAMFVSLRGRRQAPKNRQWQEVDGNTKR